MLRENGYGRVEARTWRQTKKQGCKKRRGDIMNTDRLRGSAGGGRVGVVTGIIASAIILAGGNAWAAPNDVTVTAGDSLTKEGLAVGLAMGKTKNTITFTATGGAFTNPPDIDQIPEGLNDAGLAALLGDFNVTGLPVGLRISKAVKTSNRIVTLTITGTPTTAGDRALSFRNTIDGVAPKLGATAIWGLAANAASLSGAKMTVKKGTLTAENVTGLVDFPDSVTYSGRAAVVTPGWKTGFGNGTGAVTILRYTKNGDETDNGSNVAPDTVGEYDVWIRIAEGTNFFATQNAGKNGPQTGAWSKEQDVKYANGLKITKKELSVNTLPGKTYLTKVYNGNTDISWTATSAQGTEYIAESPTELRIESETNGSLVLSGFVGDDVNINRDLETDFKLTIGGAFDGKDAGSGMGVKFSALTFTGQKGLKNYVVQNEDLNVLLPGIAQVNKAPLSVTSVTHTKVYDKSAAAPFRFTTDAVGMTVSSAGRTVTLSENLTSLGFGTVTVTLNGLVSNESAGSRQQLRITDFGASYMHVVNGVRLASDTAGTRLLNNFTGEIWGTIGKNYRLEQVVAANNGITATGGITPRTVTIVGVAAVNKTQDGTSAAIVDISGATVEGVLAGDPVTIEKGSATFKATTVGEQTVEFSGFTLGGARGKNYVVNPQPADVKAKILPANPVTRITITGTSEIRAATDSVVLLAVIDPVGAANHRVDWAIEDNSIVAVKRKGAVGNGIGIDGRNATNAQAATPDTLILMPMNAGNGNVRISATARDGSGTVSNAFILSVSGQRDVPTRFTVLTGLDKKTDLGQAILSWEAPASGGAAGSYDVSSDGSRWVPGGTGRTYTITGLNPGETYSFHVRANFVGGGQSPAARVNAAVPAARTAFSNEIVFNAPGAVQTYDRTSKGLARASLASNTFTAGGVDVWDTLYRYDTVTVSDADIREQHVSTYRAFAEAKAPVNAGRYKATVHFRNSRYQGWRVTQYTVNPKPLTAAMLNLVNASEKFTYSGEAQEPDYTVIDGVGLDLGADFAGARVTDAEVAAGSPNLAVKPLTYDNNVNAGTNTASVRVRGIGNYTGTVSRAFTIDRKAVTIDTDASHVTERAYDGTTAIDESLVSVVFEGLIAGETLARGSDFTVTRQAYNNANVSDAGNYVTATVTLVAAGPRARNYSLAGTSFRKDDVRVLQKTPDDTDFTFSIPEGHLYTGNARGIGNVVWKGARADAACTTWVFYRLGDRDTARAVDTGEYTVHVQVSPRASYNGATANFAAPTTVQLGRYAIGAPKKPAITAPVAARDTTVRSGNAVTLSVAAVSPGGGAAGLSYQWYRSVNGVESAIAAGGTGATLRVETPVADVGSSNTYYAVVRYAPPADIQAPDTAISYSTTIRVIEPAKSIIGAVVKADSGYVYSGGAIEPTGVTVTLAGALLSEGSEYRVAYSNNTNAGHAVIKVYGVDAYKDSSSGVFIIARKKLEEGDLTYIPVTDYNGGAQPVNVFPTGGRSGLGVVNATYNGSPAVPADAGTYEVRMSVSAGINFTATDSAFTLGDYIILRKAPTTDDLNYAAIEDNRGFAYDSAVTRGIGEATLKGTKGGTVTVLYNGVETLPGDTGIYIVTARVTGGDNYLPSAGDGVYLGSIRIYDPNSVASGNRVIPGGRDESAVAAPVAVAAGEFTVGPNPVAKAAGGVSFFWRGKAVKSGTLCVFDGSGNIVAKVKVADKGVGTARREIGGWDFGSVAEGTYLVKGALVGKDGAKVRVSSLVGVR